MKILDKFNQGLVYLVCLAVLVCLVAFATFKITDADTVQYIASGQQILDKGFSSDCVFSHASDQCQIVYSEWLFDVIVYELYQIGSWIALSIFQILLVVGIFAVIVWHQFKSKYALGSSLVFIILSIFVGMERFMLRADLFALVLGALSFYLVSDLYKNFDTLTKRAQYVKIFLIVLVQLLWTNIHGSFPLGLGILGAFVLADIFRKIIYRRQSQELSGFFDPRIKAGVVVLLLSAMVSFVNPYGFQAVLWPFNFFFGPADFHSQLEFQSAFVASDYTKMSVYMFKYLLAITVLTGIINYRRFRVEHLMILGTFTYLAIAHVRYIPLFAFFSAMIMPEHLGFSLNQIRAYLVKKPAAEVIIKFVSLAALGFVIICLGKTTYALATNDFYIADQRSRRFGLGFSILDYPTRAAEFISENHLAGNMFNDYQSGTYVNYRLYPEHKSFIDGHTYTLNLLQNYKEIMSGQTDYHEAVQKYNINYFLINYNSPDAAKLTKRLYEDPLFVPVYFDEVAMVFIADKPENKKIIDQYRIDLSRLDQNNLITKTDDSLTARSNRGYLFSILGLDQKALYEFEQAIAVYPKSYVVLTNLGWIQQKLGHRAEALESYHSALKIENDFALTHYNLGLYNEDLGQVDEAIANFKNAIKINPNHTQAKNHLDNLKRQNTDNPNALEAQKHLKAGVEYAQIKDPENATKEFLKAIELDPSQANAHFNLANIYMEGSLFEKARDEYLVAVRLDPNMADAYLNLGFIYRYHLLDNNKVKEYWGKYLQLVPDGFSSAEIKKDLESIK